MILAILNATLRQHHKVQAGDLQPRTFDEYHKTGTMIAEAFGRTRRVDDLAPDDFEPMRADLAGRYTPVRLGVVIQQVRQVFKWAWDNGKIDRPIRYGQAFKKPSARTIRQQRNARPARMFTAAEIHALLKATDSAQLTAMILLGVNAGFGNADCASLPVSALDLDAAMIDYPRPKTEVQRRVTLWPQTVAALQQVLAQRREPADEADAHRLFLTSRGTCWLRYHTKVGEDKTRRTGVKRDNVAREFGKLKVAAGVSGERRGFYALRHTFETVAGETGDQKAVDFLMGHAPHAGDMSAVYREWAGSDRETARLKRVTDHVHDWLWGEG